MSIRKTLIAIISMTALTNAFADSDRNECTPKITSTTISMLNAQGTPPNPANLSWIISGSCLEEVTNVSLAKDNGNGFENIPFTATTNIDLKTSLIVPIVSRGGFNNLPNLGIGIGQYLIQVKRCKNVATGDKCTTFDEKYVFDAGGALPL